MLKILILRLKFIKFNVNFRNLLKKNHQILMIQSVITKNMFKVLNFIENFKNLWQISYNINSEH